MDALSLLFCNSATERLAELKIWLYVTLAAMALVIVGAGAELIALEIAFAIGLCLRYGAVVAARSIRSSVNEVCASGVMTRVEGREMQRRAAGIGYVIALAIRRRSSESKQASFAALGLIHLGLAPRLLPQPILLVRQ